MQARRNGRWEINPAQHYENLKVTWNEFGKRYSAFRGITHSFDEDKLRRRLRERKLNKQNRKRAR